MRTGKTWFVTLLALIFFNRGVDLLTNYKMAFPVASSRKMSPREQLSFSPVYDPHLYTDAKVNPRGAEPALRAWKMGAEVTVRHGADWMRWKLIRYVDLPDFINPDTGEVKIDMRNTFFAAHEFYTWLESRAGSGSTLLTLAISYFMEQSGKRSNSVAYDEHYFESIEKKLRAITDVRLWALGGKENLLYVWYDRDTLRATPRYLPRVALPVLFPYYDTEEQALPWRLMIQAERGKGR